MSNRRNLNTYVQIDGTGKVVPGTIIFRKEKPKNGKWRQINGYQCCNPLTGPVLWGSDIITFSDNYTFND